MKNKLLIVICWALCGLNMAAQQMMPQDIPTPQAASLGKYGDIPMSYYTGRANITIPLYNFTFRGVTLPIYLSYDSSGLQPNSLPGWTGQNWTLNAGGVITRVMQGGWEDEYKYPAAYLFNEGTFYNYFQSCGAINRLLAQPSNNYKALRDSVTWGKEDLGPDIFYFNFMGISGRFFLGNDGEWKVYSDQNIEVVFDYNDERNFIEPFISTFPNNFASGNQPKTIKGFLLRDENGNKYYFGGNTKSIEYRTEFFRMGIGENKVSWTANSWYLTKVTDRHDNIIFTLEYIRAPFMVQIINATSMTSFDNENSWGHQSSYTMYNSFPYNIEMNAPSYLKKIILPDGYYLNISYSNPIKTETLYGSFKYNEISQDIRDIFNNSISDRFYYLQTDIDSIKQYQLTSNPDVRYYEPLSSTGLKVIAEIWTNSGKEGNFNYKFDYTSGPFPILTSVRKMNDAIHYNLSSASIGEYRLKYYGLDSLPSGHLTTMVDHWGYYNGNPYIVIGEGLPNFYAIKTRRNPNAQFEKCGLLKEIIYPTGGASAMEYEANDFSQCLAPDRQSVRDSIGIAGGMRIKRITEYDDSLHANILKQRTFNYNNPNTGLSSGQLFAAPSYYWLDWTPCVNDGYVSQSYFRCTSIMPLSNSFGPHVGYSYVEETAADGTRHRYHYTNIADKLDERFVVDFNNNTLSPFDMYGEKGYFRGKLLDKTVFNANGIKLQETTYSYRTDNVEANYVLTSNLQIETTGSSSSFTHYNGGVYKLFYPKYDVVKETVRTYYGQNSIYDQRIFNKSDYHLSANYDGYQHQVDIRKLDSELLIRQPDTLFTTYIYPFQENGLIYQNMYSNQFFLPVIKEYKYYNNNLCNRKETLYNQFSGKILPEYEIEANNGQAPDTLVHYLNYTTTGALNRYQLHNGTQFTLSWTNNDLYLLSKKEGTFLTTSYTYNSNNQLTSITLPNGNKTYYNYDEFGRLFTIKDKNDRLLKRITYNYQNK